VWGEIDHDDVLGRAAQLSYYFLLSLFPLLLVCLTVIGLLVPEGSELRDALITRLTSAMPPSASEVVARTVDEVATRAGGSKVSLGLLGAMWAASNGMTAVSETLNVAYDVKEGRSWVRRKLTAIALTLAIAILMLVALVLTLYGGGIVDLVASRIGLGGPAALGWKLAQVPIILVFLVTAFNLIYFFAPDVKDQKWRWVTPGGVLGVMLWIAASLLFRLYLAYFDSYGATYGSLGAVIVLMLWFYVTAIAILVGGEINAEIEHAAAERGDPEAKLPGEKAPREGAGPRRGRPGSRRPAHQGA
jgi:membrane protein